MVRICSFSGCENKHKGHGFCASHLGQVKRNVKLSPIKKYLGCSVNGCNESHVAKGFCKKHYQQSKSSFTNEKALKIKKEVFTHYSKKLSNSDIPCCRCCGEHEFLIFLTIDHITNRKNTSHRKGLIGSGLYRYLRKNDYPLGYQVLCVNCNSAKSDSGMCPHERSNQ